MRLGTAPAGTCLLAACWVAGAVAPLAAQIPLPIVLDSLTPVERETPEARIAGLESRVEADSSDAEAHGSLAREYSTMASVEPDRELARSLAYAARSHGQAARSLAPDSPEARYWLAVASGLAADVESGRTRIRLAEEAFSEAGWVLERDSLHAGAHFLRGRIHAAVMRLSSVTRFLARLLLGGDVLDEASWTEAEEHLSRAAAIEDVPMHHFSLANLYRDTGRDELIIPELERALRAPGSRPVDELYRERARVELEVRR